MQDFSIKETTNRKLEDKLIKKLNLKILPFKMVEGLAIQAVRLGLIQKTDEPILKKPAIIVFASDHGFTTDIADIHPDTTYQTVLNYLNGGAAVNVFCKQHHIHLKIADLGVNHRFERMLSFWLSQSAKLINKKISLGTRDFFKNPAMTTSEFDAAIKAGADVVQREKKFGCNIIGLSDFAAGNHYAITLLTLALLDKDKTVKKFKTFLSPEELDWCNKALRKHPKTHDTKTLLSFYGGFEIVGLCGAILKAAELEMVIVLDSDASFLAAIAAIQLNPLVKAYLFIANNANNPKSDFLIQFLDLKPVIYIQMDNREGAASALAIPFLQSSAAYLNDTAALDDTDLPSGKRS